MTTPAARRLGHYEIGEVLGDGGMGTVYAAVDTRLGRKVAIKLLHPHLARNPEVVRRFRTEAVIGAKLSHPHVVRVYDVLETEGVVGFVMEHVDGTSVDRVLEDRPGGLEVEKALQLFRQVVAGVAHAHAVGLVHRDIKPSNVLVEVVDGEWHAKVTDFGVAKVVGGETRLTGMGAKIGTLAYMSPEQIEDPASVDARSDVYSLGVLAHEMLTGQVPFAAGTEFEVMKRILSGERRRLPAEVGVSGPVADAIERCLATRRDERYAEADALRKVLVVSVTLSPRSANSVLGMHEGAGEPVQQVTLANHEASTDPPPGGRLVGCVFVVWLFAVAALLVSFLF